MSHCPRCGTANAPTNRACIACGTPLQPSGQQPGQGEPPGSPSGGYPGGPPPGYGAGPSPGGAPGSPPGYAPVPGGGAPAAGQHSPAPGGAPPVAHGYHPQHPQQPQHPQHGAHPQAGAQPQHPQQGVQPQEAHGVHQQHGAQPHGAVSPGAAAGQKLVGFLASFDGSEHGDFWVLRAGENRVGRKDASEGLRVEINHPTVSSNHATIVVDPEAGLAQLEDTQSANGTLLNGRSIAGQGRREIRDGDAIRLGGFNTTLKLL